MERPEGIFDLFLGERTEVSPLGELFMYNLIENVLVRCNGGAIRGGESVNERWYVG